MTAFRPSLVTVARKKRLLLLLPFAATACKEKLTVRPVPDIAANTVSFVFGDKDGAEKLVSLDFVEVVMCKTDSTEAPTDKAVWRIEAATKPNILKLSRLAYGEAPLGARVVVEAEPLAPGCYWIRNNHARYRFHKGDGNFSGYGDLLGDDPVFKPKK